jgi:acyl-homoserine-lactone acylase
MNTSSKQKFVRKSFLSILFLIIVLLSTSIMWEPYAFARKKPHKVEILWDTWGVPHIFAKDMEAMFYAYGWAQMRSHGDLILRLYGEARGRAAEYFDGRYVMHDTFLRQVGVTKRAKEWFKAYSLQFQKYLKAFVKGMNDYSARPEHKPDFTKKHLVVLPLTVEDVMAHTQRVFHFSFLVGTAYGHLQRWYMAGSNAWAIAPSRSASGNTMLLAAPHLYWYGFNFFYESQLKAPEMDAYGITFVGMPFLLTAFNDHMGWTHTVNAHDGSDLYELKLAEGGGYLFDGKTKPFEIENDILKVKQGDGTIKEQKLLIERSIHGPVIAKKKDKALALKVAGLDRPLLWEQWFEMARARNLQEFEKAMKRLQIPMLNVIYADRDGHIMVLHNAISPKRSKGDWFFWDKVVPGDKSETLWLGYHPYEDLPRIVDPACGWVQNSNEPIWTATFPMVLKPENFPAYMTPSLKDLPVLSRFAFRPQHSLRILREDESISFDELITYKFSTRLEMADRIIDDLLAAVKEHGGKTAKKAAAVLEKWDRTADAASRGTVLFENWLKYMELDMYVSKWDKNSLYAAPDGLKDPKGAAEALKKAAKDVLTRYSSLDVPWGDVYRIRFGNKDFPASGADGNKVGSFHSLWFQQDKDGKFKTVGGETFVAIIEFSKPLKAQVLLCYGNSSHVESPHYGDQMELMSKKKLRPVWRTRDEIEKHLERKEIF